MATSASGPEQDCVCPVCCDFYSDPVVLLCGHSFCQYCIRAWWTESGSQTCPVCKEIFPMDRPPRNLALKNLTNSLKEAARRSAHRAEEFCETHAEKFKLFCVDHQKPICVVCRDAKDHKKDNCVPIHEAAACGKKELTIALMHLRTKLSQFKEKKLTCDKMSTHIQEQAQLTEEKIKGDFQKLYQFLRAEEATRIDELRKEVETKTEAMKIRIVHLTAEITSLSDTMEAAEMELKATDLSFMLNYRAIKERAQCTMPDPETPSGALIDEARHRGNLLFCVWDKMKGIIQYAPFCLDPNTLSQDMRLSEDLMSCTRNDKCKEVPSNPERCLYGNVHGSLGFSSGIHTWDVQVMNSWEVGVLTKPQELKLSFYNYCDIVGFSSVNPTSLVRDIDYKPEKLRLKFDYDKGSLSFYDLDRKRHITTITFKSTGLIFPFFCGEVKLITHQV